MNFAPKSTTHEFHGGVFAHDTQFFADAEAKATHTLLFDAKPEFGTKGLHIYVDVGHDGNPVAISFVGISWKVKEFGKQVAQELYELAKKLVWFDNFRRGGELPDDDAPQA